MSQMIFWEEKPKTVQSQDSDVLCVHCDGSMVLFG